MNQVLTQLIGTERYVLSVLFNIFKSVQHHVLLLIGRILELRRLHRTAYPFLAIGIGRSGHFLTTQLIFTFPLLMLHPLVVLYSTHDGNSLRTKTELSVSQ